MKQLLEELKLVFKGTVSAIIILASGLLIFFITELMPLPVSVKEYVNKIQNWYVIIMIIILVGNSILNFLILKFRETADEIKKRIE